MKESSLRDLDDKMKWLKNFERLLEIQVEDFHELFPYLPIWGQG